MRWLGRGVDDRRNGAAVTGEDRVNQRGIANVAVDVPIVLDLDFEALPAPRGARLVAEKDAPHVVVDADDVEPLGREKAHRFGPNQSCRSRYHYHAHT